MDKLNVFGVKPLPHINPHAPKLLGKYMSTKRPERSDKDKEAEVENDSSPPSPKVGDALENAQEISSTPSLDTKSSLSNLDKDLDGVRQ